MKQKFWQHRYVIACALILLVASLLRLWSLSFADPLTDEPSYLFRSIGYFDFLSSQYQPTPLEWMQTRPWWLYLSFHDHPAFYFLIQFVIFKLFGISLFVGRLLPAVSGIVTVAIIIDLTRRWFGRRVSLLVGIFAAIQAHLLWISRIGLQESFVIFLIFLALWLTERFCHRRLAPLYIGTVLGLAVMTKLTALIIFPIVLLYWWFVKRPNWSWKKVLMTLGLALLFFVPQIIYNLYLYRNFGHFDFQFSYYLHQKSPWLYRPGREEFASLGVAIAYFFPNIRSILSPVFTVITFLAYLSFVWLSSRKVVSRELPVIRFITITIFIISAWLLFIGPSWRFLAMLLPWLCIVSAVFLQRLNHRRLIVPLIVTIIVWEGFFAWNTIFNTAWYGQKQWTYSAAKAHEYPYGYTELDKALEKFYEGKRPVAILPIASPVINAFAQSQWKVQTKGEPVARLLIYDSRLYGEPLMWVLTRRLIYQGWPMVSLDVFQEVERRLGKGFFASQGFNEVYYLMKTDAIPAGSVRESLMNDMDVFTKKLDANKENYQSIYNGRGEEIFRLYNVTPNKSL